MQANFFGLELNLGILQMKCFAGGCHSGQMWETMCAGTVRVGRIVKKPELKDIMSKHSIPPQLSLIWHAQRVLLTILCALKHGDHVYDWSPLPFYLKYLLHGLLLPMNVSCAYNLPYMFMMIWLSEPDVEWPSLGQNTIVYCYWGKIRSSFCMLCLCYHANAVISFEYLPMNWHFTAADFVVVRLISCILSLLVLVVSWCGSLSFLCNIGAFIF